MNLQIKKLCIASALVAMGVALAPFSIPVGAVKCFPVQHFINVLAAVMLGPYYGVGMAFATSLLRLILGTGTIMAFPGSMIGALFAGLLFHYSKRIYISAVGEVIGTGILGALAAFPLAAFIMGRETAWFGLIIPFTASTFLGSLCACILLILLKRSGAWHYITALSPSK